jgi:hypothetical protein
VLGSGLGLDHFADGPPAGLHLRAAFVFLRLPGFAVTMLFAVCHGMTLQRFRRREAVSNCSDNILQKAGDVLVYWLRSLLPCAGSTGFFDQGNLLFVGHGVDVPQMLLATLGSVLREMCARRSRGGDC